MRIRGRVFERHFATELDSAKLAKTYGARKSSSMLRRLVIG